jgi:hypothetical protein
MEHELPFPVSARPWPELSERERLVFSFDDEYLPLHPNHAAQINLLAPEDAARVVSYGFAGIPAGWPDVSDQRFTYEARLRINDNWNDEARRDEVRRWLADRGVPFSRTVYLLYERDRVVQATWRMVVRYWEAFAWSVGYAMLVVDHTLQWACCFHHEDVIVFGSYKKPNVGDQQLLPSSR